MAKYVKAYNSINRVKASGVSTGLKWVLAGVVLALIFKALKPIKDLINTVGDNVSAVVNGVTAVVDFPRQVVNSFADVFSGKESDANKVIRESREALDDTALNRNYWNEVPLTHRMKTTAKLVQIAIDVAEMKKYLTPNYVGFSVDANAKKILATLKKNYKTKADISAFVDQYIRQFGYHPYNAFFTWLKVYGNADPKPLVEWQDFIKKLPNY